MLVLAIHAVAFFVALRIFCGFTLAAVYAATDHSIGYRQAMRLARKRSASFTVLTVVGQAIICAGHLLLIVPGVILGVYLSHAPFAFVRKETRVWDSLRASWGAVSGHWWGVFGRAGARPSRNAGEHTGSPLRLNRESTVFLDWRRSILVPCSHGRDRDCYTAHRPWAPEDWYSQTLGQSKGLRGECQNRPIDAGHHEPVGSSSAWCARWRLLVQWPALRHRFAHQL